jgi:hypothetical protein
MKGEPKIITGQVMYLGPNIGFLGLRYNKTWRNGIEPQLYPWILKCPALGELIVPVEKIAFVMRQLNFDYARNMKGTVGAYPVFYREVQKWLASLKPAENPPIGITLEKHHA